METHLDHWDWDIRVLSLSLTLTHQSVPFPNYHETHQKLCLAFPSLREVSPSNLPGWPDRKKASESVHDEIKAGNSVGAE